MCLFARFFCPLLAIYSHAQQARLAEGQHLLTVANGELQVLRQQMKALSHQEKVNVGNKARAAHRVQQLQVGLRFSFLTRQAHASRSLHCHKQWGTTASRAFLGRACKRV